MQKQYVIIVAGGVGSRIKSDLPKQFLEIKGEPVIVRTIRAFTSYSPAIGIVICVHKNFRQHLEELIGTHGLKDLDIQITIGGDTRFASVKNGLDLLGDPGAIVGIHDAARPFVSRQTIASCFEAAAQKGNAIPCVPVNESMRKIGGSANSAVNRSEYALVQTPQCFALSKIKKAFEQPYNPLFTDDATVLEATGETIHLVEGNPENIKITSPHDLIIANALC